MKFLEKSNLFTTLMFMLFSFSMIGFWGCEQEDVFVNHDPGYLELDSYVLSEMSEQDLYKIEQAFGRIDVSMKHGLYHIKQKSGAQINVSEQLFDFMKNAFDGTNQIILNSTNLKSLNAPTRRLKSTSQEGDQGGGSTSSNDCMAHAISALSGQSYSTVNNYLENTYGLNGVPLESFGAACSYFMPGGTVGSSALLSHGSLSGEVIVFRTSDGAHAVNASYYDSVNGYVLYYDHQNNQTNVISINEVIKVFQK